MSANSRAFSLPETHFFYLVLPKVKLSPNDIITISKLDDIFNIFSSQLNYELSTDLYLRLCNGTERGMRALDVFEEIVNDHKPKGSVDDDHLRVVEKTPLHVLNLSEIANIYESAKFINIVRNPVDTIASWVSAPFSNSSSIISYSYLWNKLTDCANSYFLNNHDRIVTIKYEDLICDTERVVSNVCRFVELDFESKMLSDFRKEFLRNTTPDEVWKKGVLTGNISPLEEKWKSRINPGQAWLIEKITRDKRTTYNYHNKVDATLWRELRTILTEIMIYHRERNKIRDVCRMLIRTAYIKLRRVKRTCP